MEEPRSCLHHLFPPPHDPALLSRLRAPSKFPRIPNRTKKYHSFISHALSKLSDQLNFSSLCTQYIFLCHVSFFIVFSVFIVFLCSFSFYGYYVIVDTHLLLHFDFSSQHFTICIVTQAASKNYSLSQKFPFPPKM